MMSQLSKDVQPVMSSLDLLEIVNQSRAENNEPVIEPRKFIAKVEDELDLDGTGKKFRLNNNQSKSWYYDLTRDQCTLVGMRESKSVRKSVLEKLKAVESHAVSLPDFSNPVEAARAWADAKESEMKAIAEAQAAKPAVEFVERYVTAGNSKSIRETAKILRIPEKQFIQQLIDDKILYRQSGNLLPHQKHHNAGRFSVKTGEANGHAYTQTRVTGEGIDYLANSYGYMIGTAA